MKFNKDGTPRKSGSGRTKGAVSLVSVRLSDLKERFDDDDIIVIGRKFSEQKGVRALGKAIKRPLTEDQKSGITLTEF